MYYIFAIIFLCLGLFMALMPKQATKKELQNSEVEIEKTRKNGIILTVISVVFIIIVLVIS